jgi:predicted DCC family thiol-disulfide oxidoreductase YuxK
MLNTIAKLPKMIFNPHPKGQEPTTVYYDGGCGPCTGISNFTDRLDLGNNLRFEPLFGDKANELFKDMDIEQRMNSVKTVTADGTLYEGAQAMLEAASHLPVFGPIASLLRAIPGQEKVTEPIYAWVAAHRPTTCKI